MKKLSGHRLDADCVQVLVEHREEVENIMMRFAENRLG
jgi:hypothetical protein